MQKQIAVQETLLVEGADLAADCASRGTEPPKILANGSFYYTEHRTLLHNGYQITNFFSAMEQDKEKATQDLRDAIWENDLDKARAAIEAGAELEAKDKYTDHTPLHIAVSQGHGDMVQLLLDRGANIEAKDKYTNNTPLHIAVSQGHGDMVQLLLDRGADVQAKNVYNNTCLHKERGYGEIVRLLLDRGADIEAKNYMGATPLEDALSSNHLRKHKALQLYERPFRTYGRYYS